MSDGGAFVTVSVGRAGTAGANVRYMTREHATEGQQERVWTRNVPEHAAHSDYAEQDISYKERTGDLREYARQLEEDEQERPQRGSGKKRTHYRAIYSFDRKVEDEKAREMVNKHLAENFPKARAIAAIHRDTDNTHVHVQIAARGTDDKKLHFNKHTHSRLDERWARIYGQEFGKEIEQQHAAKKELWRAWMREARQAKLDGREIPPRPKRVAHERNQVEEKRKMHAKQYGLNHADQTGTRDDQRRAIKPERAATARERGTATTTHRVGRDAATNHRTVREAGSRTPATEREQQPGRVRGADRAVSNRPQGNDRSGAPERGGTAEARANHPRAERAARRDDAQIQDANRARQPRDVPARAEHDRSERAAESNRAEDRGRDVREYDSRGSFDRVLRLMDTVTDTGALRGRDQVAGTHGRDAAGEGAADRTADRKQIIQAGAERADRSADERRELSTNERTRASADEPANTRTQQAQPPVTDAARDEMRQRIHAGRLRAQYLIEVVNIGLTERETGQNAEAARQHLHHTMREMFDAETEHEQIYGGKPRVVLMPEERDYLMQNKDAPENSHTRERLGKDLGQAYVIGEARKGDSLERAPERQQERMRDRDIGFSR